STPAKIYNANVSCATLLSFVKSACIRDIEDYCKHKNIQLGIELDAVRKVIQQQQARHGLASAGAANSSNGALSTTRSTASLSVGAAPSASGSRPPSGASKSRPATPGTTRSVMASRDDANSGEEDASDEFAEALAQKELLEKQLDVVNTAAKYAKELAAGLAWVDLVDQHGNALHLDDAGAARANTIVTLRDKYSVIAISPTDNGERRVTPLVFKLHA
uniref:Uncharacterized protein n=1 Tax=Globisporangium ultimum (strain ATCC 200006 / CBS 805.95 / DAOM BR144) TaxID=431595 RepID=K3X9V8_GLOUD